MQRMPITVMAGVILLGAVMSAPASTALGGEPRDAGTAAPAAVCKQAVVNPISGYAECVDPRGAAVDPRPPRPKVTKLAVFDFELEDASPEAEYLHRTTGHEDTMALVSSAARRVLAESGRYDLVDVSHIDAEPVKLKSLRYCNGCEAALSRQAGAEQALIGVVKKVTETDYYVLIQIRDSQSGKILDQQDANFAGGPDGWPSGVRMLIKHQVLLPVDEP